MKKNYFCFLLLLCFFICSCSSIDKSNKDSISDYESFEDIQFREKRWINNEGFSIAIIPDTQAYTEVGSQTFSPKPYVIDQWKIYYRMTEFIAGNSVKNGGDFSFALHVGDHVEHSGNYQSEWELASKCFSNLNGQIPVLTVPGNHDYDEERGLDNQISGSKNFNKNFGPDSVFFKDKPWYKGSFADGKNSYAIFDACGRKFLVIGLEVNPDDNAIRWAQSVLDENKKLPAIILTHAYLHYNREMSGDTKNKNFKFTNAKYRKKESSWTPAKLWKDFISENNQIFLVVCGHEGTKKKGCAYRVDKNKDGYTTYSVLSDFQFFSNYLKVHNIQNKKKTRFCGDGWFSILDIDLQNKQIDFSCFNSDTGRFLKGEPFEMSFPIDWDWNERLSFD